MSKLSSRIYAAMKQADMSYGELSHMTGIPKSALQRYATGETEKCPLNRIEAIAKATNVSAAYLMGWENDDIPDPDFQRIKRAWECMSSKEKRKMVQILELTFEEYFDDADEDVAAIIQSKCAEMQELAAEISALASELE